MGTPLMWYAFGKTFEIYDNLISFPFQWNPSLKQMSFNQDKAVKTWLATGTMILGFTCSVLNIWHLFSFRSTWTTLNYIQVLVSGIESLIYVIIIAFAVYFTQHGAEMAALFTDSHMAMIGAVQDLKVCYLLIPPPIYRDVLGVIFAFGIAFIPTVVACILLPVPCVILNIDPFYPLFRSLPTSSFFVSLITNTIRWILTSYEFAILVRWFTFSIMQLFLVLTIGNSGFKMLLEVTKNPQNHRHLPQKPEQVLVIQDALQLTIWQEFIINLIIIQRRIVLHTRFWSYNLGAIIFILITIGVTLWATLNYALITMTPFLPSELTAIATGLSVICCFLYFTMITYVTSIEKWSARLNDEFKYALLSHKLGRRYVNTLITAKIITPYFSFRKAGLLLLFRIPFDVTVNLVLTFPINL